MAKRVQRRRGTTTEHNTFIGYDGETTVDTTKDTVVVHDGTAAGGFPLAREDMTNVSGDASGGGVGIAQLNLVDGAANQVIKTDGSGTISFGTIDIAGSTIGALGGDISGTIANALIRDNKVGVDELDVTDGTLNQFLKTDGNKNLSFGTVVTDPTMGGDIGGTTSVSVIQPAAVEGSMLDPALKQFTEDATGEIPTGGYGGSAGIAFPAGDGTTTTYTLSIAAAANNALVVSIDGIMQPTQSYSLPTTTSIQFDDPPPSGSSIRILHIGFQVAASTPADGSVTTIKLGGGAVTNTKLADSASTDSIRAVTTNHIRDDAVTTAKIAQDAVTATEIAPGTITGTEIQNASITGLDIASNAIDGSHIAIGTAQGDTMYYDGTNWVKLTYGTTGHVLTTSGAGANPYWAAGSSGTALPSVGADGNVLTSDGTNWASEALPTIGNVPAGALNAYAGATAPTGWLLCYGQSILRATYATLFTAIGTTYGTASGTTFNLPDMRGRVVAGQDDMGGTSANRLTTPINGDTLGAVGGLQTHTHTTVVTSASVGVGLYSFAAEADAEQTTLQPTIILNYIIKT